MSTFKAAPISRKALRDYALSIRKLLDLRNTLYIDIVMLLENMYELDPIFSFQVVCSDEMNGAHGLTLISDNTIKIREDVYDGACLGNGRDRFTLAHEFGHYLLHCGALALARAGDHEPIKTYCDPEWQANAFAGEFLMAEHLIKNMSPNEISDRCGVSFSAAHLQKSKV